MDRKTFINRFIRISLLGSLGILTGFMISKRKFIKGPGCSINPYCTSCKQINNCEKPQAMKTKENGK